MTLDNYKLLIDCDIFTPSYVPSYTSKNFTGIIKAIYKFTSLTDMSNLTAILITNPEGLMSIIKLFEQNSDLLCRIYGTKPVIETGLLMLEQLYSDLREYSLKIDLFRKVRNLCEYISFGEVKYINKNIQVKCYPSNYCIGSCNYVIINNIIDKKKIGFISKSCNNKNKLVLEFEQKKLENVNLIYYRHINTKGIEYIKETNEYIMSIIHTNLICAKNIIIVSKMNGVFYTLLDELVDLYSDVIDKVCILDSRGMEYIKILTHMPEFMNLKIQTNICLNRNNNENLFEKLINWKKLLILDSLHSFGLLHLKKSIVIMNENSLMFYELNKHFVKYNCNSDNIFVLTNKQVSSCSPVVSYKIDESIPLSEMKSFGKKHNIEIFTNDKEELCII